MAKPFEVNVAPEMQLYKILQRQSYGVDSALAEFVDNAIQSFLDKRDALRARAKSAPRLVIVITVDSAAKSITIEDNAAGINRENFQRAIKMGADHGVHPKDSLSVYGIGMKSASVWFSNTWSIETSALGSNEKLVADFDLDYLLREGKDTILVGTADEPHDSHYTIIKITNSLRNEDATYYEDKVLPFLKETFLKFEDVDITVRYDGLALQAGKVFLANPDPLRYPVVDKNGTKVDDDDVTWDRKVDVVYDGKKVKGRIMIMETGGYRQPGIRLLRNRRVILGTTNYPNVPTSIHGTSNRYARQRFYGELHLNDFPVNFTKTGFDFNLDGLYRAIENVLQGDKAAGQPNFIDQAANYRARKSKAPGKDASARPRKKLKKPDKIEYSGEIADRLERLKYSKLRRLYDSLCRISLSDHPVLAYVGCWALLESLATYAGKKHTVSFDAFYNGMANVALSSKGEKDDVKEAIGDIHKKGNCNKHSKASEAMEAGQLHNNMMVIEPLLIHCIDKILAE